MADNLATYEQLVAYYNQGHRYYHNGQHIDALLQHLDKAGEIVHDGLALELAIWFHDAIYKIFSSSNEQESANMAEDFLRKNNAAPDFVKRVYDLIMITLHNAIPTENDGQLMVDMDLSILGCSAQVYEDFEKRVRKEYRWVPSFIYRKKRAALLNSFLLRPRIFNHNYFYEKFEAPARFNLAKAIKKLSL